MIPGTCWTTTTAKPRSENLETSQAGIGFPHAAQRAAFASDTVDVNGEARVSLTIGNTGKRRGTEIVQLYAAAST